MDYLVCRFCRQFFKYQITHIPKSDTYELVSNPFPCLNKVMAVSSGVEGKRGANEKWSEMWVVGA
jgi:hypothetical protein